MQIEDLNNIYIETKRIDKIFEEKYDIKSKEIVHKYVLELLVEIGELANETKCFKFWSNKAPSEKNIILEEYIDCLFMILYFCNITSVNLDEDFINAEEKDIISCFINLSRNTCLLEDDLNKEIVKKLLIEILYLGKLLDFNIIDLERGTKRKSLIIDDRFKKKDYC